MLLRALFRGGILGGIVAFLFSAFSWSVLPFHMNSLHHFEDEGPLTEVLGGINLENGIYTLPSAKKLPPDLDLADEAAMTAHQDQFVQKMQQGPVAFIALAPKGVDLNNPGYFVGTMFSFLVGAILLTLMVWPLREAPFLNRWLSILLAAGAAAFIGHLPNAFMWHFGSSYTLAMIIDVIVGWGIAGLVIAWATGKSGSSFITKS